MRINTEKIPRRLRYLDVGARGGLQKPWKNFRNGIKAILVEADKKEAHKIAQNNLGDIIVPAALYSDKGTVEINLCRAGRVSSIYKPNIDFLKNFHDLDRFTILETVEVESTTIDTLASECVIDTIDFAKLDVQGAELSVMKGGKNTLAREAVGLHVEVEFEPIYEGQPLYPEVVEYVRDVLGMEPFETNRVHWIHRTKGKMPIWGDVLFMRNLDSVVEWSGNFNTETAIEKLLMSLIVASLFDRREYRSRLEEEVPDEVKKLFAQLTERA